VAPFPGSWLIGVCNGDIRDAIRKEKGDEYTPYHIPIRSRPYYNYGI